jgi:large subunit ribosomal protein L15
MNLANLKPASGSTKSRKRIARGVGSGYGGHSSTKGDKGQKARSGASIPAWFEGGQMPLQRRVPKYGFKNRFRTEYKGINVSTLNELVESGRLTASDISPDTLRAAGVLSKGELVKILGDGDLSTALTVTANGFSKSAVVKIEKAGGSAMVAPTRAAAPDAE